MVLYLLTLLPQLGADAGERLLYYPYVFASVLLAVLVMPISPQGGAWEAVAAVSPVAGDLQVKAPILLHPVENLRRLIPASVIHDNQLEALAEAFRGGGRIPHGALDVVLFVVGGKDEGKKRLHPIEAWR